MNDVAKMIDKIIAEHTVVLFMKGTEQFPQCGFSHRVVEILHRHGVEFKAVNILEDPALRQGIKDYSDWPTIPQLYVRGEFIGGCDIVSSLDASGELVGKLTEKA